MISISTFIFTASTTEEVDLEYLKPSKMNLWVYFASILYKDDCIFIYALRFPALFLDFSLDAELGLLRYSICFLKNDETQLGHLERLFLSDHGGSNRNKMDLWSALY